MSNDITRGDLVVVRTVPKDVDGNPTSPLEVWLHLNYKHADGNVSTDDRIAMTLIGGKYQAQFDTKVAMAGTLVGSIRCVGPAAAFDFSRKIKANVANPELADSP